MESASLVPRKVKLCHRRAFQSVSICRSTFLHGKQFNRTDFFTKIRYYRFHQLIHVKNRHSQNPRAYTSLFRICAEQLPDSHTYGLTSNPTHFLLRFLSWVFLRLLLHRFQSFSSRFLELIGNFIKHFKNGAKTPWKSSATIVHLRNV